MFKLTRGSEYPQSQVDINTYFLLTESDGLIPFSSLLEKGEFADAFSPEDKAILKACETDQERIDFISQFASKGIRRGTTITVETGTYNKQAGNVGLVINNQYFISLAQSENNLIEFETLKSNLMGKTIKVGLPTSVDGGFLRQGRYKIATLQGLEVDPKYVAKRIKEEKLRREYLSNFKAETSIRTKTMSRYTSDMTKIFGNTAK